jgi:hypothetical protein
MSSCPGSSMPTGADSLLSRIAHRAAGRAAAAIAPNAARARLLVVTAAAPCQQAADVEPEASPYCAWVLSVSVLSLRGPRVSWGTDVGDGLVWTVSARAALSGTPTLSGVTVAEGGRPAVPGGPVRVESMTWTTPVLSFVALGAGPA